MSVFAWQKCVRDGVMGARAWESIDVRIAEEGCALKPTPACYSTLTFWNHIRGGIKKRFNDHSSLELDLKMLGCKAKNRPAPFIHDNIFIKPCSTPCNELQVHWHCTRSGVNFSWLLDQQPLAFFNCSIKVFLFTKHLDSMLKTSACSIPWGDGIQMEEREVFTCRVIHIAKEVVCNTAVPYHLCTMARKTYQMLQMWKTKKGNGMAEVSTVVQFQTGQDVWISDY